MFRTILIALGVIALTKADLSSSSIVLSVIFPIIIIIFLSYQFVDFALFLKQEGVWTGSADDNYIELFTALYADKKYKYENAFGGLPLVGWAILELAIWLDFGAMAYTLIATFNQIARILTA